jgi:hypothetical protein
VNGALLVCCNASGACNAHVLMHGAARASQHVNLI